MGLKGSLTGSADKSASTTPSWTSSKLVIPVTGTFQFQSGSMATQDEAGYLSHVLAVKDEDMIVQLLPTGAFGSGGGSGDVTMASNTTTDNVIVTTDGTGGKAVQEANAASSTGDQSLRVGNDNGNGLLVGGTGGDAYLLTRLAGDALISNPAGKLNITSSLPVVVSGTTNFAITDNTSAAFLIKEGSTEYLKIVTTNGQEYIQVSKEFVMNSGGSVSDGADLNFASNPGASTPKIYAEASAGLVISGSAGSGASESLALSGSIIGIDSALVHVTGALSLSSSANTVNYIGSSDEPTGPLRLEGLVEAGVGRTAEQIQTKHDLHVLVIDAASGSQDGSKPLYGTVMALPSASLNAAYPDDLSVSSVAVSGITDLNGRVDIDTGTQTFDVYTTNTSAGAISMQANGGTGATIYIRNDAGTSAGSIELQSDDGGITLDAPNGEVAVTGPIDVTNTNEGTDASGTNGSIHTLGGISVRKKSFIGEQLTVGLSGSSYTMMMGGASVTTVPTLTVSASAGAQATGPVLAVSGAYMYTHGKWMHSGALGFVDTFGTGSVENFRRMPFIGGGGEAIKIGSAGEDHNGICAVVALNEEQKWMNAGADPADYPDRLLGVSLGKNNGMAQYANGDNISTVGGQGILLTGIVRVTGSMVRTGGGTPATSPIGRPVYLNDTAGFFALTPTNTRDNMIRHLGHVIGYEENVVASTHGGSPAATGLNYIIHFDPELSGTISA